MPVLTVILISQPFGLLLVFLVALSFGGDVPPAEAMLAAAAGGVAGCLGLAGFYKAMSVGPVSILAPVSSLGVIVPVAAGLINGEQPRLIQIAGGIIAIGGIALALREPTSGNANKPSARALLMALGGGVGFGFFFVGLDYASSYDAIWAAVGGRSGGSSVAIVAAIAMPSMVVIKKAFLPALLAIGVLDTLANVLFALSTRHGLLSLVSVAGATYPVATVVMAQVILGERMARVQKTGIVLALTGVCLIAAG